MCKDPIQMYLNVHFDGVGKNFTYTEVSCLLFVAPEDAHRLPKDWLKNMIL